MVRRGLDGHTLHLAGSLGMQLWRELYEPVAASLLVPVLVVRRVYPSIKSEATAELERGRQCYFCVFFQHHKYL
jgi:hypothetical protein